MPGTVLIFSGIALNAVACALLLQPVAWHAKNISLVDEIMSEAIKVGFEIKKSELKKIFFFSFYFIFNYFFPNYHYM